MMDEIERLRQDQMAQAKTISELVQAESKRQDREKAVIEMENLKEKYADEEIERINARINAIYSIGKWILASVGSVLILAIATFTIRGGFFNGPV